MFDVMKARHSGRRRFQAKSGLTKGAVDGEDSAAFSSIFWFRAFPAAEHCPLPLSRQ